MIEHDNIEKSLTRPLIDLLENKVETNIDNLIEYIDYKRHKRLFHIDFLCLNKDDLHMLNKKLNFFEKKSISQIFLYQDKPTAISFDEYGELYKKFRLFEVVVQGLSKERVSYAFEPKTKLLDSKLWYKYLRNLKLLTCNIDNYQSDCEKFLVMCSRIVNNITFNSESNKEFSLHDANEIQGLVKGSCVCCGFAGILRDCCDLFEIKNTLVYGFNNRIGGHVWNQVFLDNNWYNVDLTWDIKNILSNSQSHWLLKSDEDFDDFGIIESNNKYSHESFEKLSNCHKCNSKIDSSFISENLYREKPKLLIRKSNYITR